MAVSREPGPAGPSRAGDAGLPPGPRGCAGGPPRNGRTVDTRQQPTDLPVMCGQVLCYADPGEQPTMFGTLVVQEIIVVFLVVLVGLLVTFAILRRRKP